MELQTAGRSFSFRWGVIMGRPCSYHPTAPTEAVLGAHRLSRRLRAGGCWRHVEGRLGMLPSLGSTS